MFLLSDIFFHLWSSFANLKIKVWEKTLKLIAQNEKTLESLKSLEITVSLTENIFKLLSYRRWTLYIKYQKWSSNVSQIFVDVKLKKRIPTEWQTQNTATIRISKLAIVLSLFSRALALCSRRPEFFKIGNYYSGYFASLSQCVVFFFKKRSHLDFNLDKKNRAK